MKQSNYTININNYKYYKHTYNLPNTTIHKYNTNKCYPIIYLKNFKNYNNKYNNKYKTTINPKIYNNTNNNYNNLLNKIPLTNYPLPNTYINGIYKYNTNNPTLKKYNNQYTNIKKNSKHYKTYKNKYTNLNIPNVLTFTYINNKYIINQYTPPFYNTNQNIFDKYKYQKTNINNTYNNINNNYNKKINK